MKWLNFEFKDDYIRAHCVRNRDYCDQCGKKATIFCEIVEFLGNDNLRKTPSLILSVDRMIGIDCGCYAKGHRQIAHIQDRSMRDG